jgi:hypothetical protein
MGRKSQILPVGLFVAILGGFAWLVLSQIRPEPAYKSKPMSYWINNLGRSGKMPGSAMQILESQGSNSVPFLIKALERQQSPGDKAYQAIWLSSPSWIKSHLPQPVDVVAVRANAATTLRSMGEDSVPAIPALIRSLRSDGDKDVRACAAASFADIGRTNPIVTSALVTALNDKDPSVRTCAASSLGVPLRHARPGRVIFSWHLKRDPPRRDPIVAVPALIGSLQDKDATVRRAAANALASFQSSAKQAFPALLQAFQDPVTRDEMANALKQIDPEATAKAGVELPVRP